MDRHSQTRAPRPDLPRPPAHHLAGRRIHQSIGGYTPLAIGADGFPVVSYDSGNTGLRVAHCADVACTGTIDITPVDRARGVGLYNSLAIGTDGFPVISYWDPDNNDLKVAHCRDVGCTIPFLP